MVTKGEKMPDKKVSKSSASRPLTPSQKLEASLSDSGTVNMAEPAHDKARAALDAAEAASGAGVEASSGLFAEAGAA